MGIRENNQWEISAWYKILNVRNNIDRMKFIDVSAYCKLPIIVNNVQLMRGCFEAYFLRARLMREISAYLWEFRLQV